MSDTVEVETGEAEAGEVEAGGVEADASCVCRRLRTKTAFGSFRGKLYAWQSGHSTTAVYWCLRTMETVGPDDTFAHPHACLSGRGCFEPPE
jgi:hypothetical protein